MYPIFDTLSRVVHSFFSFIEPILVNSQLNNKDLCVNAGNFDPKMISDLVYNCLSTKRGYGLIPTYEIGCGDSHL